MNGFESIFAGIFEALSGILLEGILALIASLFAGLLGG